MSSVATVRPSGFHWMSLISLFEGNAGCGIFRPEDNDDSDSESSATDASKLERKGGFQDVYTLKVIVERVFPDEDTSEAETAKPFPYYSPPASEGCDDDDLKTQLSEDRTTPANAEDWNSDVPDPLLLAIGKSVEKKVAEKKQELGSAQSIGITKTRDVDMLETTVREEGPETETKDPIATLKTGKLDEVKTVKDAKHDDFEEDTEMYTKAPAMYDYKD